MAPPSASCHRRDDVIFTSVVRCWLRSSRRLRVAGRETRQPGDKSEAQDRQALAGSPAASRAWRPRAPCRASQAIGDLLAIGTVAIKNSTVPSPSGFSSNGLSGSRKTSSAHNLRAVCTSVASQPRRRSGGACQVSIANPRRRFVPFRSGLVPNAARTTSILQQCG